MRKLHLVSSRFEVNAFHNAKRISEDGSLVALIYSSTFGEYSARRVFPHERYPDRADLFDWASEDSSEIALAAFQNGRQLEIFNSPCPRKIVINSFPMHKS